MSHYRDQHILRNFTFAGALLLLCSCAPASTGLTPSTTLKEQLDSITQQQQEQARQLDQLQQQLDALQQQWSTAPASEPSTDESLPADTETPAQAQDAVPWQPRVTPQGTEQVTAMAASAADFLSAFSHLAAGRWQPAATGFTDFLEDYPGHQYSPSARYWLAQAQLGQGREQAAMENLQALVTDPGSQDRAPAALLQLAQIYSGRGQDSQAGDLIRQLHNRFPQSPEAQQTDPAGGTQPQADATL